MEEKQLFLVDADEEKFPVAKLAYYAGLFDGEGHVSLYQGNPRFSPAYSLRAIISIGVGHEAFLWLKHNFGGSLHIAHPGGLRRMKQDIYYWTVFGGKAARFLKAIHPYLVGKRQQVDLALDYYEKYRAFRYSSPLPVFLTQLGQHVKKALEELRASPLLPLDPETPSPEIE